MPGYYLFGFGGNSKKTAGGEDGASSTKVYDSEDHSMTMDDIYHFFDTIQEYNNSYVFNTLKQIMKKQIDNERYNIRLGENNIATVLVLSLQYYLSKPEHENLILPLLTIMKFMCRYDGTSRNTMIEDNLDLLHHAGTCDVLPQVLIKFQTTCQLEILECTCEIIGALAVTEEIQAHFGDTGTCQAILQLLQHFATHSFVILSTSSASASTTKVSTVIEKACAALWNLSINDRNEKLLGELGGCELMVQLLSHYWKEEYEEVSVVEKVCAVVWNLSVLDTNEERLNRVGAYSLLMKIFQRYVHTTHFGVIEKVCGAIHNIAQNERYQEKLGHLGFCVLLVKALNTFFDPTNHNTSGLTIGMHETLILEGCGAIWHLSEHEQNVEKLGLAGACEVMVTVLHYYLLARSTATATSIPSRQTIEQVVKCACGSLRNLSVTAINIVKITTCGSGSSGQVLQDLQQVMTLYGDTNVGIYVAAREAHDRLQLLTSGSNKQHNNNISRTVYDEDEDIIEPWQ